MKQSTPPTVTTEPMGIVITTGSRAPIEPRVRAYYWGGWDASQETAAISHSEKNRGV